MDRTDLLLSLLVLSLSVLVIGASYGCYQLWVWRHWRTRGLKWDSAEDADEFNSERGLR